MRGRICFAALVAAALFASPAYAGVASVQDDPSGDILVYTAGAGQTNVVTVEKNADGHRYLTDTSGVTPGFGCITQTATRVQCFSGGYVNVTLGDGNDVFTYTNGVGVFFGDWLTIDGGPGNDGITGGDRNDTLTGGADTDTINGGDDSDTIDGGTEDDALVGGPGNDTINGGLGGDIIFGGTGNDTLNGDAGNDGLYGEAGADLLGGGAGADTVNGGDDDDRLLASYHPDVYQGGPGFDTVDYTNWQSCLGDGCIPEGVIVTFDGVANDGNWDLDSDGITFVAQDNVQTDVESVIGTAIADTLGGGTGTLNQSFTGAGGNDTITGGPGTDTIAEAGTGATPVSMTLTNTTLTGSLGSDSFTGIETASLAGGNGNDTIDASAFTGPVKLHGGPAAIGNGADRLIGGSGNDEVTGSVLCCIPDNDVLTGGPGNDAISGSNFRLLESGDVNFALTNTTLAGLGTDTLTGLGTAELIGGPGNNTLNASGATRPVILDGGAGIDLLQGGSGADTLTGGPGADTFDGGPGNADMLLETADTNMTLTSASMSGLGADALSNVEQATLNGGDSANVLNAAGFGGPVTVNGGAGADTITGGPLADTLNGGDGNDTIAGGDAMDALNGDADADVLNGGLSLDVVHGGEGNDVLDGGADAVNDLLDGDEGENRVVASADTNLTLTDTNLIGLGTDTLVEITRATLTGGAGDNALNASAFTLGPVILSGGAGADSLLGGSGGDTLTGGPGLDTFDAGAGADTVQARDGTNETSIVCGTEADTAVLDKGDVANADCELAQLPDTTAPNTKLKKSPKAKTKSHKATFGFSSTEPGSKFQCKLDKKAWAACKAPKTYKKLKKGKHTFQVRATDLAGNRDKTPAKKTWRIT